jgi:Na+/proline symporter
MAVKSTKDLKKLLMFCTIFATILPLMSLGGILGIAVVDKNANIAPDQIIPVVFSEIFPPFVAAFFAVAVLSAVMSTADGLIVSLTQLFANDLYRRTIVPRINISPEKAERYELLISRYSTFLVIAAGIWLAWSPPKFLSVFMWIGIGGIVSATAGPLVVGALWKKATKTGAILSMLAGTLTYWFVYLPIGLNFTNPFGAAGIGVLIGMFVMIVHTLLANSAVAQKNNEQLSK